MTPRQSDQDTAVGVPHQAHTPTGPAAMGVGVEVDPTSAAARRGVLLLNGPNLNRLGKRQPEVYGTTTLADVEALVSARAAELGIEVRYVQSNHEGELIDAVHEAAEAGQAVIVNPGGLTHTSVSLRDALAEIADGAGFVEVHISNVHAREDFRHHSYLTPIADGVIAGLGTQGYLLALNYLALKPGPKAGP